jgi:nucleotide-binding universal stress UspA family protein
MRQERSSYENDPRRLGRHRATAIARLAEEHDVDLVVVGTRELGALQRLLGQSGSQAVSRRVRCDLLIVHPGG